ncbi:MAG: hypothetical protein HY071_00700 [Chloroflexi bacterium]|nr:hypothetical protein [Chloroflexota bacterium]
MDALVSLPLVLAVVLLELAVGGAFLIWFIDRTDEAPGGFLKLAAFVDAAVIAFALALNGALPQGATAVRIGIDIGKVSAFGQLLVVVTVLVIVQLVAVFTPWKRFRAVTGAAVVIVGVTSLALAASARPSQSPYDVFALLALPLGALALGGSDAAMLLGHWYLVTPKLSTAPLERAALVVVVAVVLQSVLVAISIARGELTNITETALFVAVAIRVGVGLLATLGVALGAWWTARMNTQSSTGLLYVGLGMVLAGEISARVVFFLTGAAI